MLAMLSSLALVGCAVVPEEDSPNHPLNRLLASPSSRVLLCGSIVPGGSEQYSAMANRAISSVALADPNQNAQSQSMTLNLKNWGDLAGKQYEFRFTTAGSMTTFGGKVMPIKGETASRVRFREVRDRKVRLLYWSDLSLSEPNAVVWVPAERSKVVFGESDLRGTWYLSDARKTPRTFSPGTVGYELNGGPNAGPAVFKAEDVMPLSSVFATYKSEQSFWENNDYRFTLSTSPLKSGEAISLSISKAGSQTPVITIASFDSDGVLLSAISEFTGEMSTRGSDGVFVSGEGTLRFSIQRIRAAARG